MALDSPRLTPLYQGPDINRIRVMAEACKKPAFSLKSLAPSRNKLTTIETQRIMSVLDETIHKVELVTLLSSAASNHEGPEEVLGEDIMKAVREHEELSQVFLGKFNYVQDEERRLREEEAFKDEEWFRDRLLSLQLQKSHLPPLMQQVKESTKDLLRLLLRHPQAARLLQMQSLGRSAEAQRFIDGLMELRGFLFQKLLTSPMEARDKARFVQAITRQNKRNQEVIDALESELTASSKNRDAEVWIASRVGQVQGGVTRRGPNLVVVAFFSSL